MVEGVSDVFNSLPNKAAKVYFPGFPSSFNFILLELLYSS
jgi:hypothetical protein